MRCSRTCLTSGVTRVFVIKTSEDLVEEGLGKKGEGGEKGKKLRRLLYMTTEKFDC